MWMQLCTQAHDDESTVRGHDDDFKLTGPDYGPAPYYENMQ
jgi:hypothetical protein